MGTRKLVYLLALVGAATQAGIARAGEKFSDVVEIAPDTYMISRIDHGGIFGNAGKMRTKVMKEAQDFAESKGKVAVVQHIQESPMVVGHSFASIDYTFWVLDKNDADARRGRLQKEADVKVDVEQRAPAAAPPAASPAAAPDLYSELMKLDDLRKRGILTDAEFEAQKAKLLAGK